MKEKPTQNIEAITNNIRLTFTARDQAREKALPLCREIIRYASTTIRAVHRQELKEAAEMLKEATALLKNAQNHTDSCGVANTAYLRDAEKEYAEASIVLALVSGITLPTPDDLNIDPSSYLNGLGEAVGELRRYLLDNIRKGDLSRGEELLEMMDDIYSVLVTVDFPDAITGGLRRTTDMVRGVLEKTRSDLTLVIQQKNLENRLDKSENKTE
jgi:translin